MWRSARACSTTSARRCPGEVEGSHAAIGAEFIKRHGETPIVVNAVAAHHEEVKPETVYAGLTILADTISATRPGARAESMSSYIKRLDTLEKLAMSIEGVQQAFAIQAGREIRVVVAPEHVTDDRAREIAKELRRRIESDLQYPSTIKITVIRREPVHRDGHLIFPMANPKLLEVFRIPRRSATT